MARENLCAFDWLSRSILEIFDWISRLISHNLVHHARDISVRTQSHLHHHARDTSVRTQSHLIVKGAGVATGVGDHLHGLCQGVVLALGVRRDYGWGHLSE